MANGLRKGIQFHMKEHWLMNTTVAVLRCYLVSWWRMTILSSDKRISYIIKKYLVCGIDRVTSDWSIIKANIKSISKSSGNAGVWVYKNINILISCRSTLNFNLCSHYPAWMTSILGWSILATIFLGDFTYFSPIICSYQQVYFDFTNMGFHTQ